MGHTFSRTIVQTLTAGQVTTILHAVTSTLTRGVPGRILLLMETRVTEGATATAGIHIVATAMVALVFNVFPALLAAEAFTAAKNWRQAYNWD